MIATFLRILMLSEFESWALIKPVEVGSATCPDAGQRDSITRQGDTI